MVGIDPASDGLARAARLSVPTTHEGVEGLRRLPNYAHVGVVFDATSAGAHIRNNEILKRDGKKVIDLTPAAIGPFTIPVINGDASVGATMLPGAAPGHSLVKVTSCRAGGLDHSVDVQVYRPRSSG